MTAAVACDTLPFCAPARSDPTISARSRRWTRSLSMPASPASTAARSSAGSGRYSTIRSSIDSSTTALKENKDLKRARANLRASRAARRLAGFDLFPTVTAGAGYTKLRESRNQLPAIISEDRTLDDADVGFDAFWELDFFGRVRRGIQAARAEEQASAASLRDAQVTVTAEVARNYFVLRGLQEQLAVARAQR